MNPGVDEVDDADTVDESAKEGSPTEGSTDE